MDWSRAVVYKALGQRGESNDGCWKPQKLIASPSLYAQCLRLKDRDSFAIIRADTSKHEEYNVRDLSSLSGSYVPFCLPFLRPLSGGGFLPVTVEIPPLLQFFCFFHLQNIHWLPIISLAFMISREIQKWRLYLYLSEHINLPYIPSKLKCCLISKLG